MPPAIIIIGRREEVGVLLDCWKQAREGRGQVVLVSGEAGIGKTRLALVLREQLDQHPHTWMECRGSPFHQDSALHPVIDLLPDQRGITNLGGTMRLGAYPCRLVGSSKADQAYGTTEVSERHRHRYEFNNEYRESLSRHGLLFSGFSPDGTLVETVELSSHPWFVGGQFHPEFKSRPRRPHPLFREFIRASLARQAVVEPLDRQDAKAK